MPIHIAPPIRALEEALELAGLIVPLDSVGVTVKKAQEAVGLSVKVVPVNHVYVEVGPKKVTYKAV